MTKPNSREQRAIVEAAEAFGTHGRAALEFLMDAVKSGDVEDGHAQEMAAQLSDLPE